MSSQLPMKDQLLDNEKKKDVLNCCIDKLKLKYHENPNVVRLYNKYKDKGFTVYSVSLDQNKDKWLAAIAQDQLTWSNHVSELTGWKSSAGAKYGISSIPKTFLINKKGKIIGYDLRGNELGKKLSEIL